MKDPEDMTLEEWNSAFLWNVLKLVVGVTGIILGLHLLRIV